MWRLPSPWILYSQIRKTPIVVNDARFFYANRCIIPYINEGHADDRKKGLNRL